MNDHKTARILIIKLGALGDFVMQMDYVQAIHKAWPEADVTFMTSKAFVPFVECLPYVHHIITDTHPRLNLKQWWKICKNNIADQKWDYIFDLQNSRRTRSRYFSLVRLLSPYSFKWISFQKKAPMLVRSVEKKRRFSWGKLSTDRLTLPLEPVDLSVFKGKQKNFNLLPEKKFVLIIPGCSFNHPEKRYPKEKYAELTRMIEEQNIPVVVLGTKVEKEQIDYICANTHAIDFCDKASLLDIPALASRALCVIGNDTGPVHMACFSKTKGIVLFGQQTAKSAQDLPNVVNMVATQVADIATTEIYKNFQLITTSGV